MSDDGLSTIVVIALLGSPFSPDYARARRSPGAQPLDFCGMNVALHSPRASAWALCERRVGASHRDDSGVELGRSAMRWEGDALVVRIDEACAPFGGRIQGKVVLRPEAVTRAELCLDAQGRHRWWPVAPLARIDVDLPAPGVRFRGHGYHDANAGAAPLEDTFARWSWSRARAGAHAILAYDVELDDGDSRRLALRVDAGGRIAALEDLPSVTLPRTGWGLERSARSDRGSVPGVVRELEDGPFYARALLRTRLEGAERLVVHETLDAGRLRRPWVRFLSRFRMRSAR